MSESEWRSVRAVDQARLHEARLQAHYAAQWLARFARGYIPPQLDDGHTNLGWDAALAGFVTHPLADGLRLALEVANLRLMLLAGEGVSGVAAYGLDGRTDAEVRAWLGEQLSHRKLDASALDAPAPYEMPPYAIANKAKYTGAVLADELGALALWYDNANAVLGRTRQRLVGRGLNAPSVRCWPHHFDLDTLVIFPSKDVYDTRMMGVGFSPGDEYYDEPYFYISLYPDPDVAKLPALMRVGHWHTHEFAAAVAPASKIVQAKDQGAETEAVLDSATDIAIKVLSRPGGGA